ncbi:MAG: ATP-dependent RNA helicase DbpA [Planctomycetes bacterium]|nr:ATP-dependent RNA helicase DbpA [Planctomycetota bacterium]
MTGRAGRDAAIAAALARHFGFGALRPLQRDAIDAALDGRDALVVLPTGGGKSLCYQLPPLVTGRLTVVVSPLIALMKDQVDGLRLAGYPAAALHSNVTPKERADLRRMEAAGELRLLFVAPERLFADGFLDWIEGLAPGAVAIDEAHCISQWGHDFRPEYRRLAELRDRFERVPFHAYTATATPRVREDIATQLRLRDPAVLVGTFDRPNLTYRVLPRHDLAGQVTDAIRRHPAAASIVYCIARKDTEELAASLRRAGIDARAYHAGLDPAERARVSEDFRAERLHVVVATVAFGMGIDRGDVRLVVHGAMPKSVEHYQQETGRAGRDGLPAECLLLYTSADGAKWRSILARSAAEGGDDPPGAGEAAAAQIELLSHMQRFAGSARCRHRALSEYFGQEYPHSGCGACDVCLRELEEVPDGHVIAQKILSAVARTGRRFGSGYVIDVLRGSRTAKVVERGHDRIPTFGLLKEMPAQRIGNFIDQLVDAGALARTAGEYPVLEFTEDSARVLRGERRAVLVTPRAGLVAKPRRRQEGARSAQGGQGARGAPERDLAPAEEALFEALRALRRGIASELGVPPYIVFGDVTLEELARVRPTSEAALLRVKGVGAKKLEAFGARFLAAIAEHPAGPQGEALRDAPAAARGDSGGGAEDGADDDADDRADGSADGSACSDGESAGTSAPKRSASRRRASALFRKGATLDAVAAATDRAPSTVVQYLVEFLREEPPASLDPWVAPEVQARVLPALASSPDGRLRPVFDQLAGAATYDQIRMVRAFVEGKLHSVTGMSPRTVNEHGERPA